MRKNNARVVLILCLIAVAAIVAGTVFLSGNSYSTEYLETNEIFDLNENEAAILTDGFVWEEKAPVINGKTFIPYDLLASLMGNPFYYEDAAGRLYLTLPSGTSVWTAGKDTDVLYRSQDGKAYIEAGLADKYSDAEITCYKDPDRVCIISKFTGLVLAETVEDTQLRALGNKRSPVVADLPAGTHMFWRSESKKWSLVTTMDGYVGYTETAKLTVTQDAALAHESNMLESFDKNLMDGTVRMVWHYVDVQENNDILDYMLEDTGDINVICPTWIYIENKDGDIYSLADKAYAENIRRRKMKLWTMVSDYTGSDADTGTILGDHVSREKLVSGIMKVVKGYGLDGVNIDFETIKFEQMPAYLQFLRELSLETHKAGVILSADNYVPAYTLYYDRTQQAKIVDYVVIMGYDEHTEYSEKPGSVASLPFVREGIEQTLEEVPAEQVILGVPFYTRSWEEPFGAGYFKTDALSMPGARDYISEHGIKLEWNEAWGQYYGTSEDSAARYSIWMEDGRSLEKKLDLIKEYGLAGASAWRLGLEESDAWKTWNKELD